MARKGFDYFAGANVVVFFGDIPLLECAGISYEVSESKRPIYGYASRYFDGVAYGQSLVQGELLINYVHQDYLFEVGALALEKRGLAPAAGPSTPSLKMSESDVEDALAALSESPNDTLAVEQELISSLWSTPLGETEIRLSRDAIDLDGGLDIKIAFGRQDALTSRNGQTGVFIEGCYFTGRGQQIVIDESVAVERYTFFARKIHSLLPGTELSFVGSQNSDGDSVTLNSN